MAVGCCNLIDVAHKPPFRILRRLGAQGSVLACDHSGKRVVLKPLPASCIFEGQLHTGIRERLQRVRELPVASVATLIDVTQVDGQLVAVWEFVEGQPLADAAPWKEALEEAHTCLVKMHLLGIVHGAIHSRNIIIAPDGSVKLTHVSPLLFNDPRVDRDALRALKANLVGPPDRSLETESDEAMPRWRARTVAAAAVAALIGISATVATARYVRQQRPAAHAPPVVRDSE
jgi:hypothetical protein